MSVEAFLISLASDLLDLLEHSVPFEDCFLLPEQLSDIELPIITVHVDKPMYRLNSTKNRKGEPITTSLNFDRTGNGRFDGKNQGYGILYTGQDASVSFIESFGRIPDPNRRTVTTETLRRRNLFLIMAKKPLKLVDLTGSRLHQIGADTSAILCSPQFYEISRKWGKAIHLAQQQVDGIRFRSRLDNDRYCYGIFDRAESCLEEKNLGNLLDDHQMLLNDILKQYKLRIPSTEDILRASGISLSDT
jgi:hypothetical protein